LIPLKLKVLLWLVEILGFGHKARALPATVQYKFFCKIIFLKKLAL